MAVDKYVNIEKKIRDKYMFIYRMLCIVLMVLIPVFWIITKITCPDIKTPVLFREALIILSAIILIGSFKSKWVQKNMQNVMMVLYALVTLWQLIVLNWNNFEPNQSIGFILVAFGLSIGFESRKHYLYFIIFFLGSVSTLLLTNPDAIVGKVVFLVTLSSILLLSYFFTASKINMENVSINAAKKLIYKNKETTDSIKYAKRIQYAILPSERTLEELLPNSFVLYKPKAIVSGDFYWLQVIGDKKFFAVADCTGHGVPGAMVSVICHNALNRAVREFNLTRPSHILDKARELIVKEFEQSEDYVSDGMDISLCTYNIKDKTLDYAGAHNPFWLCRNNELIEIKADKQPIGNFTASKPFTNHAVQIKKGDIIYLNTDGYSDQFGGPEGKKMKKKYLKEYIVSISNKPLEYQREILNVKFEQWMGDYEQIDDVCIMGIRI